MFEGIIPILLTPFTEDGDLDYDSLRKLTEYYIKEQAKALVCLGEVSEPSTLKDEEKINIVDLVKKFSKGIPLICGISRESVDLTVTAAKEYSDLGVSGYLLAPPKNPSLSQIDIFNFYKKVDEKVDLPIVILDQPAGIRPKMSPEIIAKIVNETNNVRYWKVEDQPTPMKMEKMIKLKVDHLITLGASHGRNFFWELERGASGILTSTPMPEILSLIYENYQNGNIELAREIFYFSIPVTYYYSDYPVAVKKEILRHNGYINSSRMREEGLRLSDSAINDLIELVEWTKTSVDNILKKYDLN